ncbi:DNA polymerase delta subunit 2-like [Tubulanus polymorphus]|uniref:DNA polymerase delta subunit 2-like n=1 Tax=Tubulanus polymorphus TaxID=672921 RepID=UPI003DA4002D
MDDELSIDRCTAEYKDLSERFKLKQRNYERQYAHVYSQRLITLKPRVVQAAKNRWGEDISIVRLFELESEKPCVVIGTLFKKMVLKPNILKELCTEQGLLPQPVQTKYTDDSDVLILEDELQRIVLEGDVDFGRVITGVVIAVKGVELDDKKGKFQVEDYCFVDLPPQAPLPEISKDRYLAVVSGFELNGKTDDLLSIELFEDLLTGELGEEQQQRESAKIVRLVILGNSMSKTTKNKSQFEQAKYLSKHTTAGSVDAIKSLDDILTQIVGSLDVDLMAGDQDPANYVLPQQPMHRCMFPQAMSYPTLHTVTNPYECSIDNVQILFSSGESLSDIYKYTSFDDRLEILEQSLKWGHLTPTAPDTLGCYPYYDEDPFIISQCPHIYVVGNQSEFGSKTFEGREGQKVCLVTLPKFSSTQTCALINLRNLEIRPVKFNSSIS